MTTNTIAQEKNTEKLIQQGKQLLTERSATPGKIDQALVKFEKALALDSNSEIVHAALAETYTLLVGYARIDVSKGLELARYHGEKAFNLNPNNLYVLKIRLRVALYVDLDTDRAEKICKEILKRFPDDIGVNWKLVELAIYNEKLNEAQRAMAQLIEKFPDSATDERLAWHLYLLGDFSKSYDHAKMILAKDPTHVSGYFYLSRSAAQLGKYDEAISSLAHVGADAARGNLARHAEYISYLALSGDQKRATVLLQQLHASPRKEELFDYKIAQIYAALGEKEMCIELLQSAIRKKETFVLQLNRDPMFFSIPREQLPKLKRASG